MVSLNIEFAGVEFENPFLLSSAPPTRNGTQIKRAIESGWGGAVTKTITLIPEKNTRPRLGFIRLGKRLIGMTNIELTTELSFEQWKKEIKIAKEPGAPIIGSIMADVEPDNWIKLTQIIEQTGVDMLELNFSCPHGAPDKHMGAFLGQDPELVRLLTKTVKENCSIPVIVKLTPNVTSIAPIVEAGAAGGADGFSAINTVLSLIGIDIETGLPFPNSQGKSTFGGYSGPAVRPIALRIVAQVAKTVDLPISGIGGVDSWKNAIEFMMVGAKTVQVCTAVMWRGYKIIEKWKEELSSFMKRKGYHTLNDFIGQSLNHIGIFGDLEVEPPIKAHVKYPDKCTSCGKCVTACSDGAYSAITLENEIAQINSTLCDGCGLCVYICPTEAINMVEA
ncbi:MAG: NAD-dependent dihydropyrimidine dehydrogenase subunit PreA [Candidatus Heimdallarchaeota archaeon]